MKKMSGLRYRRLLMTLLVLNSLNVYAVDECGGDPAKADLGGISVGDYNDPRSRTHLKMVDDYHFDRFKTHSSYKGIFMDNMDYTLRHFPNHHRALHLLSKREREERARSERRNKPFLAPQSRAGFPATAECYFNRAIRFRPKDPVVHMLYGIHLHFSGKLNEALKEYKASEQINPKNAELEYNLGLLYFDLKQYALARQHAERAYQLGYPLRGLQNKLARVK